MDLKQKTDALVQEFKSLGIENVYFNPPESVRMKYPCVRFRRSGMSTTSANNSRYLILDRYDAVYITYEADDPMVHTIVRHFKHCRHVQQVIKDGLVDENYVLYY